VYAISTMKLLLVEDDQEMADTIISWLRSERYEVSHCVNGLDGKAMLESGAYDVAILDWELPGMGGIDILKQYRANRGTMPVLVLTGKAMINDRVTGLDAGADDYLTKPFSLKELSARVRALSRRPSEVLPEVLTIGELSLDVLKYRVMKRGVEVQLMPREFALLEFFMRSPDVPFSAEALLKRVWSDDSESSNNALRNAISRLRSKIDDGKGESDSLIENIPGVGYRLRIPRKAD
jgi:DNA-binding response OmpR family regulator